jgi:osmotically inducible protein OsmC
VVIRVLACGGGRLCREVGADRIRGIRYTSPANASYRPDRLETTATITLEKVGEGFSITKSHLDLVARVPGADKGKFDAAVKAAETGCPVSKLFKADISVNAQLES